MAPPSRSPRFGSLTTANVALTSVAPGSSVPRPKRARLPVWFKMSTPRSARVSIKLLISVGCMMQRAVDMHPHSLRHPQQCSRVYSKAWVQKRSPLARRPIFPSPRRRCSCRYQTISAAVLCEFLIERYLTFPSASTKSICVNALKPLQQRRSIVCSASVPEPAKKRQWSRSCRIELAFQQRTLR